MPLVSTSFTVSRLAGLGKIIPKDSPTTSIVPKVKPVRPFSCSHLALQSLLKG